MNEFPQAFRINSPQNGFLLKSGVHQRFDQYLISVNPDDGYKVVEFGFDGDGLDGRILDPACRDRSNPHRICDLVLRWHIRQAVGMNVKGTM